MEAQALIDAANQRLKSALFSVSLKLRGNKISLRAVLPPKPHSDRMTPHQQTISLGLPSNLLGIQQAEAEAIRIGTQLITGGFSWKPYLRGSKEPVRDLLKRFEQHHRSRNKISDLTWERHYLYYYKHLPQDKPLCVDDVLALIMAKQPHTRARQQICRQMQKLCDYTLIDVNLLEHRGRYSSSTSVHRDVPSDEQIVQGYRKMRSHQWRWAYGLMATFGLRDHECWLCEFASTDTLRVLAGKTGDRLIQLPLYPEWIGEWNLLDICRPDIKQDGDHQYLAKQCAQAFKRAEVGFTPYDLRYAYGHRGNITFNYQPWMMAQQMGHSLDVHLRIYQRFINERLIAQKLEEMKARGNQPKPPAS